MIIGGPCCLVLGTSMTECRGFCHTAGLGLAESYFQRILLLGKSSRNYMPIKYGMCCKLSFQPILGFPPVTKDWYLKITKFNKEQHQSKGRFSRKLCFIAGVVLRKIWTTGECGIHRQGLPSTMTGGHNKHHPSHVGDGWWHDAFCFPHKWKCFISLSNIGIISCVDLGMMLVCTYSVHGAYGQCL